MNPKFANLDLCRRSVGGAVDFVIDDAHIEELFPGKKLTRDKFTYQLSDHLPIWIQMKVDIDGFRLGQIVQGRRSEDSGDVEQDSQTAPIL